MAKYRPPKGGPSPNPTWKGRPRGSKDKVPRGSVRGAYEAFIATGGGVEKMTKVIDKAISGFLKPKAGVEKGRLALSVIELGAKVLDRIDQQQEGLGAGVTINVLGINPMALRPGGVSQLPAPEPPVIEVPGNGGRRRWRNGRFQKALTEGKA